MNRFVASSVITAAMFAIAGSAMAQTSPRDAMLVTADWLKTHAQDKDLVVLQVGDRKGYDAGHIPGSQFVDSMASLGVAEANGLTLEMPAADALHKQLAALGVTDKSRVVVSFGPGSFPAATRVIFTLEAAGLSGRTVLLDGGLAEWQRLSYPLTTAIADVKPGALAPLKIATRVVDAAAVQERITAPGYRIVDARAAMFYDGLQPGGMPAEPHPKGHIPGAISLPFSQVTGIDSKLKPAADLAAAFKGAGVQPGDKLIVYCHVGWQGTAVVFAARSLGIDAALYDGSFQDWSKRNLPVASPAP